jgi:hypothetical protein
MTVSVAGVRRRVLEMPLRTPFHFGDAAYRELPHLFLAVELDGDHAGATGVAADHLSPLWFHADPDVTFEEGLDATHEVVAAAADRALDVAGESAFDYWRDLYAAQASWAADTDHPPLLWAFGVSLVERAVIDAVCRATETTFAAAVRANPLGIELGAIHPELAGTEPADYLPAEPSRRLDVRHTVGASDSLTADDLGPGERLDDGLPETLREYVERDGLSAFKVKLTGDVARDADRLSAVEAALAGRDYAVTLDANEQYGDPASFRRDWAALTARADADDLLSRVRYVEQPLARGDALTDAARETFTSWTDRPPVVVDESDGELDSLRRALACGYAGTSHKNCKGVFKGVANACYLEHRRRENPDRAFVLTGEDLSTVGPVSLQQDLAVMATLGVDDVERNGYHYFRGESALPESVQSALLDAHGDLYRRHEDGFAALDVADGALELESVVEAPFGRALELDVERLGEPPVR